MGKMAETRMGVIYIYIVSLIIINFSKNGAKIHSFVIQKNQNLTCGTE